MNFTKLLKLFNKFLINLKNFTFNKSIEIQQDLVATYNKELQSTDPKGNLIGKNLQASYNTASKTINKLNDDYLTPLKEPNSRIMSINLLLKLNNVLMNLLMMLNKRFPLN